MKKLWHKLETALVQSRLRLPLYIITIIFGVGFFIEPNIFMPTIFVIFLGLLIVFESIIPTGYPLVYKSLTNFLPRSIQTPILVFVSTTVIFMGLFIMFIGLAVEMGRLFR
ncbi:hypothetical protein [Litchfieldia alkalitelluris]|uniref:hypothetical protein n=1 Tax=Litchfieldia alkalitelluris TaxID=304268 RepID=UPI000995FCDF|nr:hypothetical protein [Litchfieldia alkalitelluris]